MLYINSLQYLALRPNHRKYNNANVFFSSVPFWSSRVSLKYSCCNNYWWCFFLLPFITIWKLETALLTLICWLFICCLCEVSLERRAFSQCLAISWEYADMWKCSSMQTQLETICCAMPTSFLLLNMFLMLWPSFHHFPERGWGLLQVCVTLALNITVGITFHNDANWLG